MKKLTSMLIASSMLFGAQAASATTFTPGTHVFSGAITVQKDGLPYNCNLNVNVNATASSATATASLSGTFPCSLISVTGTGVVTFDGTNIILTGLTITPPLSPGQCTGPIRAAWGGNSATPRTLGLSSPLSDSTATAGVSCKMVGPLRQISGGPLNITNP